MMAEGKEILRSRLLSLKRQIHYTPIWRSLQRQLACESQAPGI